MPVEDLISEVVGPLFRGIVRVLFGLLWEGLCRWVGYWTLRLITFGRYEPDEEGWFCALLGLAVLIASAWGLGEWLWG
ncbi:MAG: hypothetical protein V4662_21970 [Verrucomicrobiota bacterium]